MSGSYLVIIGFSLMLILFLMRMPVAFVMGLVGFLGFAYKVSTGAGLAVIAKAFWSIFSSYDLTVVPMFVFMGSIAFYSGISGRLFNATHKFLGARRGGLAMATIVACAGFAAICGSTNASAAAMGKATLPEMKRFNYAPSLATGSVAAGGTLGILIPPSAIFIIYGILTEQSVGKLFAAGIIPGIILTLLFICTIFFICRRNPALAPVGAKTTLKEKLASLSGIGEALVLFLLVMGGLFVGWFTPTEAGAVGAGGALLIVILRRQITWSGFVGALVETTRITCMIFVIVTGAVILGRFLAVTRAPFELAGWIGGLPLPPPVIMAFIVLGYLFGGCFMDSLALITLTIPVLFPVIETLGYDPIWFGVIIVLVTEMGVITPPVGINVYVIKGVAPDIALETIFKGVFPFLSAIILTIIILLAFPSTALFLPSLM
ncbi:MAG: TRAP transporter large permease [Deltaproteobacteria bacterium]|nr:TRAP transporter large permease [Deltaproteobacteria bacterium]